MAQRGWVISEKTPTERIVTIKKEVKSKKKLGAFN